MSVKENMLLYSSTRCFICYLLLTPFFVIGWHDLYDEYIDSNDQAFQEVDIFDMFKDSKYQVPKSAASTQEKEKVREYEHTPNYVCRI